MDRENLKALIRERGFTYESLGAEIGITPQAVSEIVAGRTTSSTARYSIAAALGVDVADIWPARAA